MTTANAVVFGINDIELLYSIPQPGADLATIIRTYVFLNRSSVPLYSVLRDCFTKALQSGVLLENRGRYRIAPDWYGRLHAHDDSAANEIESMLAFEDEFVGIEVPVVASKQADVTEEEYVEVVRNVQR